LQKIVKNKAFLCPYIALGQKKNLFLILGIAISLLRKSQFRPRGDFVLERVRDTGARAGEGRGRVGARAGQGKIDTMRKLGFDFWETL
jgi:hypothetical protein